jgi:hypothetical protein
MPMLVRLQYECCGQPAAVAVASSTKTDASCNGGYKRNYYFRSCKRLEQLHILTSWTKTDLTITLPAPLIYQDYLQEHTITVF